MKWKKAFKNMVQWPWKSFSDGHMRLIMGLLPWPGHALNVEACRDVGKQCFQNVALVVIRSIIHRCLVIMWRENFIWHHLKTNSNPKDYRCSLDESTGLCIKNGHQLCSKFWKRFFSHSMEKGLILLKVLEFWTDNLATLYVLVCFSISYPE